MIRPRDPRNHGKKPQKIWTKTDDIYLADLDRDEKVPLSTLVSAWNKALKDIEDQGYRIIEGPYFEAGSYYGRGNKLTYTYEQDNPNYEAEIAEWNAAIAQYELEFEAWKNFDEERKQALNAAQVKSIDAQIERTERRLANLRAVKAGELLPYPKG